MHSNELVIKQSDCQHLEQLIAQASEGVAERLDEELARADIVQDGAFPADAVCLDSEVTYCDSSTGRKSSVRIVLPRDSNVDAMKISILSPMGSALIGMRQGGTINWPLPNGRSAEIEVLSVVQH